MLSLVYGPTYIHAFYPYSEDFQVPITVVRSNISNFLLLWSSWLAENLEVTSVQFSPLVVSDSLWPHELQHTGLPYPSLPFAVCSSSWPQSWWCYLTISFSDSFFSCCLKSFPASGSFPMSQIFLSCGQSIGASASASASVLPMNIQDWFPLGLTGVISLQSKGFSRVFSNTTVQKHQFFHAQPSLWSNSLICAWPLEKP